VKEEQIRIREANGRFHQIGVQQFIVGRDFLELKPKLSVSYVDLTHGLHNNFVGTLLKECNPVLSCAITWTDCIVLRMGISSIGIYDPKLSDA